MERISRRNFVALATASVAVGACDAETGTKSEKAGSVDGACIGFPETYGDDPHEPRTEPFPVEFIGVVYIGAGKGWELTVNHAAFRVETSDNDAQRLAKAIKVLEARGGNGRFKDLKDDLAPHPRKNKNPSMPDVLDSDNFDKYFGFKSKNELFIFIDGDVELTDNALISFTPYNHERGKRDPNYAFYGARKIDATKLGKLKGRMISVRNYMTLKGGEPISEAAHNEKDRSQTYSMNIHFTVPGSGTMRVPIVIDPDTGNGQGNEP
jgi:hypothetical protein